MGANGGGASGGGAGGGGAGASTSYTGSSSSSFLVSSGDLTGSSFFTSLPICYKHTCKHT